MFRRFAIALCTGSVAVTWMMTIPAHAFYFQEPFDRVIRGSDSVWWATVSEAEVSKGHDPGYWTLSVDIIDGLKGPGTDGGTGTVFRSECGMYMSQEAKQQAAGEFVGQTMLFMGEQHAGGLVAYPELLKPNLTPPEQYRRALSGLGRTTPDVVVDSEDGGSAVSLIRVWAIGFGALLLIAGSVAVIAARRSKGAPS
jgi:hypothetical protein